MRVYLSEYLVGRLLPPFSGLQSYAAATYVESTVEARLMSVVHPHHCFYTNHLQQSTPVLIRQRYTTASTGKSTQSQIGWSLEITCSQSYWSLLKFELNLAQGAHRSVVVLHRTNSHMASSNHSLVGLPCSCAGLYHRGFPSYFNPKSSW